MPKVGICGYPRNFYLTHMQEEASRRKATPTCPEHRDTDLELFCKDCNEAVCWRCFISHHRNHDCLESEEAGQFLIRTLAGIIESAEMQNKRLRSMRKQWVETYLETKNHLSGIKHLVTGPPSAEVLIPKTHLLQRIDTKLVLLQEERLAVEKEEKDAVKGVQDLQKRVKTLLQAENWTELAAKAPVLMKEWYLTLDTTPGEFDRTSFQEAESLADEVCKFRVNELNRMLALTSPDDKDCLLELPFNGRIRVVFDAILDEMRGKTKLQRFCLASTCFFLLFLVLLVVFLAAINLFWNNNWTPPPSTSLKINETGDNHK